MSGNKTTTSTEGNDLVLSRIIDAPPEKAFNAWTNPALIKQWFAPAPGRYPRWRQTYAQAAPVYS